MYNPNEFALITIEDAQMLLKALNALTDDSTRYKQLIELGAMDLYDQLREFVKATIYWDDMKLNIDRENSY